jgi:hypothetical protein
MSKYTLKCISWTVSTCGSWSPARRTAPRHNQRADRRMALAGALLGRSDRREHLRGERQTNLREVHGFFSISLRRAAARGRITTTTKTNGSISSKAG